MNDNFDEITAGGESWDTYTPPVDAMPQPDAGVYQLIRNTEEGHFRAGVKNDDGEEYVWYGFTSHPVGTEKFDSRYVSAFVSTRVYGDATSSSLDDFLHSAGAAAILRVRPNPELLLIEAKRNIEAFPDSVPYALERIVGPFTARIDWEWKCRQCEDDSPFLVGQRRSYIPRRFTGPKIVVKKTDGKADLVQNCPVCNTAVGAQLVVKKFLTTTKTNGIGTVHGETGA